MLTCGESTETVVEPMEKNEDNPTREFIKYVFTHPEDREKPEEEQRQLSYAEMRMRYG